MASGRAGGTPRSNETVSPLDPGVRQFGIPGLAAMLASCQQLRDITASRTVAAGEALFWEDDTADFTCLLTDGTMKAYKLLPNGRSQIVRFIVSGEIVDTTITPLRNFTVEALSDCVVLQLPRAAFERVMSTDPVLMRAITGKIAEDLQMSQKHILLLGRMPAIERVSHFLLDFAMRQHPGETALEPGCLIELPMTRADIADYLGLTIETVSRVFSKFRRDGLIELPRPHLVSLCDQTGLLRQTSSLSN